MEPLDQMATAHTAPPQTDATGERSAARRCVVCVVSCSTADTSHETAAAVIGAIPETASVRAVLLSETGTERADGIEVVGVPSGTKLSKMRRLAALVPADLFCVCDPDLAVNQDACGSVVQRALEDVQSGKEVVAFGVVEGRDDGTLLSQVVAVDKWLSHRVLRRILWAAGLGITLPGQFLVVSPSLLRDLDPKVDSYLDDLYLGWIARERGASVRRVPVDVGAEDPRTSWLSLATQRVRWMRGLACLFRHLGRRPAALGLLAIHLFSYHVVPLLVFLAFVVITAVNPLIGCGVFVGLAATLVFASRQRPTAVAAFLIVFPLVHALALLLWWAPVKRSFLTRR